MRHGEHGGGAGKPGGEAVNHGGTGIRLILASASPRRRELLGRAGLPFTVMPSRIREEEVAADAGGPPGPAGLVRAAASAKAEEVAARLAARPGGRAGGAITGGRTLIIGADTVVVLGSQVLGKPADEDDARRTLRLLSGRVHRVFTGVALIDADRGVRQEAHEETAVHIRTLDDDLIAAYTASGEPMDKAGSYAVQGLGSTLVKRIEGCYFNVVGLPLARLADMLDGFGVGVADFW